MKSKYTLGLCVSLSWKIWYASFFKTHLVLEAASKLWALLIVDIWCLIILSRINTWQRCLLCLSDSCEMSPHLTLQINNAVDLLAGTCTTQVHAKLTLTSWSQNNSDAWHFVYFTQDNNPRLPTVTNQQLRYQDWFRFSANICYYQWS